MPQHPLPVTPGTSTRPALDTDGPIPQQGGSGPAAGLGSDLVGFLSLDQLDRDLFRGWCHAGLPLRAFGGQVAAQALTAAGRTTADGHHVHSLHGYFLRAGDTRQPILYHVDQLRDGRSYLSRRVTAVQGGVAIFTLSASFKLPERYGDRHPRIPDAPLPEELPDPYEPWAAGDPEGFEMSQWRRVMAMRFVPDERQPPPGLNQQLVWLKSTEKLPDDPLLHVCALAYCSDLTLAPTAALDSERPRPLREGPPRFFITSLDHAMWFHRPFRADEWMLFAQRSPSAGDGRGLSLGEFWTREGTLVASVVQEAVLRPHRS
ncbi:acyl-CoA thioesterase II [Streptomyces sp. NBC_00963]|uniref:acyl-CoA thioesterase n=1 Tax=Streptomyces sp. NBC_00963 TaxID=2903697 RepID=UPI00386BC10F|nr:acyl-CoA thioesterase II [Streptomyces sp. NBC_00963]